jgi:hypothetical protein
VKFKRIILILQMVLLVTMFSGTYAVWGASEDKPNSSTKNGRPLKPPEEEASLTSPQCEEKPRQDPTCRGRAFLKLCPNMPPQAICEQ